MPGYQALQVLSKPAAAAPWKAGPRRIPSCDRLQSPVPHPGNTSQSNSTQALGRMLRDDATRLIRPVAASETRGVRRALHTKVRDKLVHPPRPLAKGPHRESGGRGQRAEQGEDITISVARNTIVREVHTVGEGLVLSSH
jgi:hypothetical protein